MLNLNQSRDPTRLDRGESAFFAREAEHIKARTYDIKLRELKAFSLIPVSHEAGPGVNEITFRRYNGVGFAKIIGDYAKDFPRVDVYGVEDSVKVKSIGDSYGYNIKEIRMSNRTGKGLDSRRAATARRAHDEMANKLALISNPAMGTRGLIDYPGITETTIPADGSSGSTSWANKTEDQILRDIDILFDAVIISTFNREVPDTLLLPLENYRVLGNRRIQNTETTLMKYIMENKPWIKKIDWLYELSGAGAGKTNRAMVGMFDEEHITFEIPQPFEQFDARQDGMEYTIPCHSECAGCIVYYPMAFALADGV
ncbi:MAG: DUF2184 domain-containing protein [Treponema sp.]|jgi:hypothetical protein|nr:DUF2184 domain-containing protein [Treponema sp.]